MCNLERPFCTSLVTSTLPASSENNVSAGFELPAAQGTAESVLDLEYTIRIHPEAGIYGPMPDLSQMPLHLCDLIYTISLA